MAEPVNVFVAWDSDLKAVDKTFQSLAKRPPPGLRIDILGAAGQVVVGHLHQRLREGISGALIGVVDQPNANVAWEIGLGLSMGRRVALATEGAAGASWLKGTPLESVLRQGGVGDGTIARAHLAEWKSWPVAAPTPRGGRKLLLCASWANGVEWRAALAAALPEWELLDVKGWTLTDLPNQLAGIDRLAWVVLPLLKGEERHGVANTIGALVAGYADGLGADVGAFFCEDSPAVADAAHRRRDFDGPGDTEDRLIAAIKEWSTTLDKPTPTHRDPVTAYLAKVVEQHANPLRYVEKLGLTATNLVPVELDVEAGGDGDCLEPGAPRGGRPGERRAGQLRALIGEDIARGGAARWLVKAEPGAGKTTLLRQLAHDLAAAGKVIPIFVALADWEDHAGESVVDAAVRQSGSDPAVARLLSRDAALLWVFLDGFDEVRHHDVVCRRIQSEGRKLGPAALVVTSRAGAIEQGRAWEGFTTAGLRHLSLLQQQELAARLLGDAAKAATFDRDLKERPGVASLLRNPFLLTLAVGLHAGALDKGRDPPHDRVALLTRALDDCLARGWAYKSLGGEAQRRWSPDSGRLVLRALSLQLHEDGKESWSRRAVADALNSLPRRFPKVANVYGHDGTIWRSDTEFLDDVQHHAGVLGPLDGDGLPWRFLHRSLREMLAAECLADELDAVARNQVIDELMAEQPGKGKHPGEDGAARSAEVLALLVGLLQDGDREGADPAEPVALLRRLVEAAPDAAVRALAAVERLDAWEHLQLLLSVPPPKDQSWRQVGWDNDQLDDVLDAIARGRGADRLWAAVVPGLSTFHLGVLWYALERVETWGAADRRWSAARRVEAATSFFAACGLDTRVRPAIHAVALEGGTFKMGSPDGVGNDEERPQHAVAVGPFHLGRTPITVVQYRAFAPAAQGADNLPATRVDWFAARLFAAWVGGRLPTEAEWEYACRAGTETLWSCGDDEERLGEYAWYRENSDGELHAVGEKQPNPLGLRDMHGNVWEWCEDRFGTYPSAQATDPVGPARGSGRVLRGGSFWIDADGCRSACRGWNRPGGSYGDGGFRVVLPAPRPVGG